MMQTEIQTTATMIGTVVISRCGHDMGRPYIVIDEENGYLVLSDGKKRRICRPKKKKRIHCIPMAYTVRDLASAIAEDKATDKMLRRALAAYRAVEVDTQLCERRDSSAKG